jgi:UDPglucose 6-dehydrogenase
MSYKISIVGMGYVGCGNALLLSKDNEVSIVDIDPEKVEAFNNKQLPINDHFAQSYFENEDLQVSATTDLKKSIDNASFIVISLPTNFNDESKTFDTSIIESVIKDIVSHNTEALIIIKSTVNIGYTELLKKKLGLENIIFSPEFLREGHALKDNLFPSRIIIGGTNNDSKVFGELLRSCSHLDSAPLLFMSSTAAESVKLFSNTYLAMRVAYFNELDGFCMDNNINTRDVIKGVSMDQRIGNFYNNPSFGFGGYCLPKDSKQLLNRFEKAPHNLIKAVQISNFERAKFLASEIITFAPKVVGIYKLAMKEGSDNSRDSSIYGIIKELLKQEIQVLVHDTSINELNMDGVELEKDFKKFTHQSDLIITNRLDTNIKPYTNKLFTRDVFSTDE